MSKRKLTAGIQSVSLPISVADTSSTVGGGLAGLVFNTSGLVAEYRRQGQSAWTAITLVSGTLGTFVNSGGAGTGGGIVADGALAGDYELCVPDAALAGGARWVIIRLRGATNMLPVRIEIELDQINYQDAVRAGLTSLPNAAFEATGGLGDPADFLAALKADSDWQTMLGGVNGVFTFNPNTGVMVLHDKTGVTLLGTLTLTRDAQGNITSRASA